jgi:hypothetical protein
MARVDSVRPTLSRVLLATALTSTLVGPMLAAPAGGTVTGPMPARQINYAQWSSTAELSAGTHAGVHASKGRLRLGRPVGNQRYVDPHSGAARTYSFGHWTSPWTAPGFGLTELIPSWNATTPGGSWVQIQVRGRSGSGQRSSWDTIANWSRDDATIRRTSLSSQADDLAQVATDTWRASSSAGLTSWQLRVTLLRRSGTTSAPTVDAIGAMASRLPNVSSVRTSRPGVARGITLNVPEYSQMTHRGDYPKYGNGGEAWCSPTATSMVLGYYDRLPSAKEYSWVKGSHGDRFVDHAARMTYDYEYEGTGNWPFNTAYAATYVRNAFVTRLRSLREAERFIKAGIPVVASVAFGPGELAGAPISSTNGHLMVIVGFTSTGNVVVNDPAAPNNASVRRVYSRGQFENAWLPKSGGLVYVIRTEAQELPERSMPHNW